MLKMSEETPQVKLPDGLLNGYEIDSIDGSQINGCFDGKATIRFHNPHADEYLECSLIHNQIHGEVKLFNKEGVCFFSCMCANGILIKDSEMHVVVLYVYE